MNPAWLVPAGRSRQRSFERNAFMPFSRVFGYEAVQRTTQSLSNADRSPEKMMCFSGLRSALERLWVVLWTASYPKTREKGINAFRSKLLCRLRPAGTSHAGFIYISKFRAQTTVTLQ